MTSNRITRKAVIAITARAFGVTVEELCGPSKKDRITPARFAAMALAREFCGHLSLPQIGQGLGGRDHSTVLHGVRRAHRMALDHPSFRDQVEIARQMIVSWGRGEVLAGVFDQAATHVAKTEETPPAVKCEDLIDEGPIDVARMRREGLRVADRMGELLEGASTW